MVSTPGQSEDVDVSTPRQRTVYQQLEIGPLLGFTMALTPIMAALLLVYVGPVASAIAAIATTPLILAAIYVEGLPLTPYTALEREWARRT